MNDDFKLEGEWMTGPKGGASAAQTLEDEQGGPLTAQCGARPAAGEMPAGEVTKGRGVTRRPMTAEEIIAVVCLGTQVTYAPGTWDKKFAKDQYRSVFDSPPMITQAQAGHVWRLFKRYRNQIKHDWKERLLAMAEDLATPEMRRRAKN